MMDKITKVTLKKRKEGKNKSETMRGRSKSMKREERMTQMMVRMVRMVREEISTREGRELDDEL